MRFGAKIKAIIKVNKWLSLKYIAHEAKIPYSTLLTYTQGTSRNEPTVSRGMALAKALGVDAEWLFNPEKDWPPVPYHQPPPFEIMYWPPTIKWEEIRAVLDSYWHYRNTRINEVINKLSIIPDVIGSMIDESPPQPPKKTKKVKKRT